MIFSILLHDSDRFACSRKRKPSRRKRSSPSIGKNLRLPISAKAFTVRKERACYPSASWKSTDRICPLGTDLLDVRYAALHAAEQEYAVVFPEYYFGQIAEARHEPGTMAYSRDLQLALLQETTDEMARNGCKKVIIVNGHGGNESLLPYFAQTQLDKPHDYVVYVFDERTPSSGGPAKKTSIDMHAGESETSKMMISRPDTVHIDRASSESGADQHRQNLPEDVYTGIWWYARFPNHYSGDGSAATKELGKFQMDWWIDAVVKVIRAVKADDASLKLQNEFYEKSKHPLDTQP